jgi:mycoredoxin
MNESMLAIFTTTWCGDCRRTKAFLERHGIPFREIDIEQDPEAMAAMKRLNGGKNIIPTLVFPDGTVMTNPKIEALAARFGNIAQEAA